MKKILKENMEEIGIKICLKERSKNERYSKKIIVRLKKQHNFFIRIFFTV